MKKYALSGLIAFLLVASVFVTGCMTSEKNTSSTQTSSTLTSNVTAQTSSSASEKRISHDATVEKFVNEIYNELVKNFSLQTWDVKWLNNTMVNITYRAKISAASTVLTVDQSRIILRLRSTDEATAYINNLDRTEYEQSKEAYPGGGFYDKVVGHNPTTFRMYMKQSDSKVYSLAQLDDTIVYGETTIRSG